MLIFEIIHIWRIYTSILPEWIPDRNCSFSFGRLGLDVSAMVINILQATVAISTAWRSPFLCGNPLAICSTTMFSIHQKCLQRDRPSSEGLPPLPHNKFPVHHLSSIFWFRGYRSRCINQEMLRPVFPQKLSNRCTSPRRSWARIPAKAYVLLLLP